MTRAMQDTVAGVADLGRPGVFLAQNRRDQRHAATKGV